VRAGRESTRVPLVAKQRRRVLNMTRHQEILRARPRAHLKLPGEMCAGVLLAPRADPNPRARSNAQEATMLNSPVAFAVWSALGRPTVDELEERCAECDEVLDPLDKDGLCAECAQRRHDLAIEVQLDVGGDPLRWYLP
jgi:hypothetical protein